MPTKRPAGEVRAAERGSYMTEYCSFAKTVQAGVALWHLRRVEAMQELPDKLLAQAKALGPSRFFFVATESAVNDFFLMIVHFIFLREALRSEGAVNRVLHLIGGHTSYAREFLATNLAEHMRANKLCNVDNFFDRGSFFMRWCASALLALAFLPLDDDEQQTVDLCGPALTEAAVFGVLTGGFRACVRLRAQLQATCQLFC